MALLNIIDWTLNENQKKWLKTKAEDAWLWLAYREEFDYLKYIFSSRVLAHSSALLTTIIIFYVVRVRVFPESSYLPPITRFNASVSLILASFLAAWKTNVPLASRIVGQSFNLDEILIRWFLAVVLGLQILPIMFIPIVMSFYVRSSFLTQLVLFIGFFLCSQSLMIGFLGIVLIIWLVLVMYMLTLLSVLKFILWRVVTHEKGVVLGLSAILILVGALMNSIFPK